MNIFLFLLAGLISGYFTYTNTVPFWSSFYGSPASGAVIGKFLTMSRGIHTPHLKLQYARGLGNATVSWNTYYGAQSGQIFPVHYFYWAPSEISVDQDKPSGFEFWINLVLQFALLLLVPCLLTELFYRIRKQKFLLINGKADRGTVTSRNRNNVKYEFEFESQKWKGNSPDPNHFESGIVDGVLILFDPNKPKNNIAYDESKFFCLNFPFGSSEH